MVIPSTDIPAVPPKQSDLADRLEDSEQAPEYVAQLDETIRPAVGRFTAENKATLNALTDASVDGDQVYNHRKRKLFFLKPRLENIVVSQLVEGLNEFVHGVSDSHKENQDFFVGPNLVKSAEIYLLTNREPIEPFSFLRLHNLIRAAKKLEFRRVTNLTEGNAVTKGGFDNGAFVASIWAGDPRIIKDTLDAIGEDAEGAVISALQTTHKARVAGNLFRDHLLKSLSAQRKKDRTWCGVTEQLAQKIHGEMDRLVKERGNYTTPPFEVMFPCDFDTTHDGGNRRVIALSRTEGNMV